MKNKNIKNLQQGFTLIELLVVIGILAILLAITLIAINPARQFQQANNTKRSSDVNAILNAIHQYAADNRGQLPGGTEITAVDQSISNTGADLCSYLVPQYIAALPSDPTAANGGTQIDATGCTGAYDTEYNVVATSQNRVTVSVDASNVQLSQSISVTR